MPKSFLIRKNQLSSGSPKTKQDVDINAECYLLPITFASKDENMIFDRYLMPGLKHLTVYSPHREPHIRTHSEDVHFATNCQCKLCVVLTAATPHFKGISMIGPYECSLPLESNGLQRWFNCFSSSYLPFNDSYYSTSYPLIPSSSLPETLEQRTSPVQLEQLSSPCHISCSREPPRFNYSIPSPCPTFQDSGMQTDSVRQEELYSLVHKRRHASVSSESPLGSSDGDSGHDTVGNNRHKPTMKSRYECSDCSKSYSTFIGLSKHQKFHCMVSEKKTSCCKHCDKVYTSLPALKMHIRTHTLPCKCSVCGKAFSRPWLLQGHVRTHTGEKPFFCPHCNRAFADRSNLRSHLQTHSDVKKYKCKTCNKTFSRMSLLVKHEDGVCENTNLKSS
ncbi:uncharacterized protein LOC143256837 isoform X1 [Tachypleus tridentatus]|uniref:uncharacterized protein LOC143256837 isoform X1 n=1 Tax=Tachypleus tridentatus TaxID=6853 RepID=UPI003FD1AC06